MQYKIGFLGFGHMAQILFQAIDKTKIVPRSHISFRRRDPAKMKKNEQEFGLTSTSLENLVLQSDLLILAVRPQQIQTVISELKNIQNLEGKWIVSILAGVPLNFFESHLGKNVQLIRAMPNVCSAVNEGMTPLTYNSSCSPECKSFVHLLFNSIGEAVEISEKLMDFAVGMSGSGPAFVLRLIEKMARAGEKQGMNYSTALKIAAQTFLGASRLVLKGSLPSDLLSQIATPQGTTQAGLETMDRLQIDAHFEQVIEAAAKRSKELGRG